MAWTAVWCCCTPAPAAPSASVAHRGCCVLTGATPNGPARPPADCPIDHVRGTSVAPVPPALPDARPVLCVGMARPADLPPNPAARAGIVPVDTADPPRPPPTLLALHTSLVC